jgi:ABC-type transporter lipoprotein component MlaA
MFSLSTDHFMHFEIDELDFLFLFPILNEYTRYIIDTYRNKRNNFFSKLDQNLKAVNVHSVVQDYAAILKTL